MANPLEGEFPKQYPIFDRLLRMSDLNDLPPRYQRNWHPLLSLLHNQMGEHDPYRITLCAKAAGFTVEQLPTGFPVEAYSSFMTTALKISDRVQGYVLSMAVFEDDVKPFIFSFLNCTPDVQEGSLRSLVSFSDYGLHPFYHKLVSCNDPTVKETVTRLNFGYLLPS